MVDYSFVEGGLDIFPNAVDSVWQKDPTFWNMTEQEIQSSLGWLESGENSLNSCSQLLELADSTSRGVSNAVLIGMGGSNLGPRAIIDCLGTGHGVPVSFADSTNVSQVRDLAQKVDLSNTLFIVSSKSGSTLETLTLLQYFYEKVNSSKGSSGLAGSKFVAITDLASPLETLAYQYHFDSVIRSPTDVGGRYSVLTAFGIYPAAISGVPVRTLLAGAVEKANRCRSRGLDNPAVTLSRFMIRNLRNGRDKMAILFSPELQGLAEWVEQLLSESLGKDGRGILPITGMSLEDLGHLEEEYGVIHLRHSSDVRTKTIYDKLIAEYGTSDELGDRVFDVAIDGPGMLGGEFLRWEFATAITGGLMGVNPFDQPQVESAKIITNQFITQSRTRVLERMHTTSFTVEEVFDCIVPGSYLGVLAYLPREEEIEKLLSGFVSMLAELYCVPITVGFGPSYLHSTGQMHKGGPDTGCFIQLTCTDGGEPMLVPGEDFDFQSLSYAQADGDLKALIELGRKVTRVELGLNVKKGMETLASRIRDFKK